MNKINIGTKDITNIYVGQSLVNQVYVGTTLMFARNCSVGFTLDSTVDRVVCTYVDPWGESHTETIKSSVHLYVPFGSSLSLTAYPKAGYSMQSYTTSVDRVDSDSLLLNFTTSVNAYVVNVNLCNTSGTEYGNTYGDSFGTFKYSWDNTSWSNAVSDLYTSVNHGTTIYIKDISSAPGWYPNDVNGTSYVPQTYEFTVNADTLVININCKESLANTRFTGVAGTTFSENAINKTGFNVSARMTLSIGACDAGATIATIPNSKYRPKSNVVISNVGWMYVNNKQYTTYATLTITPDGNVVTDTASIGPGSAGGKNVQTTTWIIQPSFTASWSTA